MDLKKEIAQAITDNQYESLEKATTVILSLVKVWGEELCPHNNYAIAKHHCDKCWKELGK